MLRAVCTAGGAGPFTRAFSTKGFEGPSIAKTKIPLALPSTRHQSTLSIAPNPSSNSTFRVDDYFLPYERCTPAEVENHLNRQKEKGGMLSFQRSGFCHFHIAGFRAGINSGLYAALANAIAPIVALFGKENRPSSLNNLLQNSVPENCLYTAVFGSSGTADRQSRIATQAFVTANEGFRQGIVPSVIASSNHAIAVLHVDPESDGFVYIWDPDPHRETEGMEKINEYCLQYGKPHCDLSHEELLQLNGYAELIRKVPKEDFRRLCSPRLIGGVVNIAPPAGEDAAHG